MADTPVTLSVFFEAVAGREKDLADRLSALIEPTRKEPGCLYYELHVDPQDTKKLFFFERFKSEQALNDHVASPYFQEFVKYRESGNDPVASVTVTKWATL